MTHDPKHTAVIIVDHGSRRAESNQMLLEVVSLFAKTQTYPIVEPAHMELAPPSIADAFDTCVRKGAATVICQPFFLLPGNHWKTDIPGLMADAAKTHPNVNWLVTAPLGPHKLMADIMNDRIKNCIKHTAGNAPPCPMCEPLGGCQFKAGPSAS